MRSCRVRLNKRHIMLLAILLTFTVLNNFSTDVAAVGFLSIFTVFTIALFFPFFQLSVGRAWPRPILPILLSGTLLIGIYVVGLMISGFDQRAWVVVAELIMVLSFVISTSIIEWTTSDLRVFGIIFSVFIMIVALVYLTFSGAERGSIANKNTIGGFLAFLSYWPIVSYLIADKPRYRRIWFLIDFIILVIICIVGARSTWLALAGGAITYLMWPIIKRSKFRFRAWIFLVLGLMALFMNFYLRLSTMPIADVLQRIALKYTGGRLYSGRQYLWPPIIEAIKEKPLFGYGASATPSLFLSTGLSSHNLYLQIAIQVGILGLLFFVILICVLWDCFWNGRNTKIVRLSAAFMVATLIHQLFEVSLTQNNMAIGLLQWMIIGQGISFSIGNKIAVHNKSHSSSCNVS